MGPFGILTMAERASAYKTCRATLQLATRTSTPKGVGLSRSSRGQAPEMVRQGLEAASGTLVPSRKAHLAGAHIEGERRSLWRNEMDIEIDPIWELMPSDQAERVFAQDMCDIDPSFLGFTNVYLALASLIPLHWTVVDLGCAYAPQAIIFAKHKRYVGVDMGEGARFSAANTAHYQMSIGQFLDEHLGDFDQNETFAICSYVPEWYLESPRELVQSAFKNVFTYYPHGGHEFPSFGVRA
jgi:hypothetical protein